MAKLCLLQTTDSIYHLIILFFVGPAWKRAQRGSHLCNYGKKGGILKGKSIMVRIKGVAAVILEFRENCIFKLRAKILNKNLLLWHQKDRVF